MSQCFKLELVRVLPQFLLEPWLVMGQGVNMPKTVFSAIEKSVSAFLGGAKITLTELATGQLAPEAEGKQGIVAQLKFDEITYLFRAYELHDHGKSLCQRVANGIRRPVRRIFRQGLQRSFSNRSSDLVNRYCCGSLPSGRSERSFWADPGTDPAAKKSFLSAL